MALYLVPSVTEGEERLAIIAEARSWVGTPYHENAAVKGAGVDCGMLPLMVFSTVGLIEFCDPRPYPSQWHLHQKAERYLELVLGYAREVENPKPADLVMFKIGHTYSHAAIVVEWPTCVIHANGKECQYDDPSSCTLFRRLIKNSPPRFFSVWPRQSRSVLARE